MESERKNFSGRLSGILQTIHVISETLSNNANTIVEAK